MPVEAETQQVNGQSESILIPNSITFTLPSMPPSINALYQIIYSQRRVEMKPEVRRFKSDMKQHVPHFTVAPDSLIQVDLFFYYPFYFKNGQLRDIDTQNLIKVCVDLVAEKIGVNDKRAKKGSWDSDDDRDERVVVTVTEITNTINVNGGELTIPKGR